MFNNRQEGNDKGYFPSLAKERHVTPYICPGQMLVHPKRNQNRTQWQKN